ncbi:transposase [Fimbriiglobus ruber]|uniref:Transposase IS701-like DDE domain-containing protein n=1 Tax=Fimbriiglobus ruber TaxID=1908690 RepID=A0A225D1Q1_9BACT|nr:transposase [Fimbriiglobus ruber]OWK35511.1 hypothetical protein FRUB_08074 [Fimbriiglobus ruber]
MSHPKVSDTDDIDFLIASPRQATATEGQRTQPASADAAHDAYTRLLHRLEPDPETLWRDAEPEVRRTTGVLVLDDTVLDKPYTRAIDLVHRLWSGKHRRVVQGIGLLTLLWTDGDRHVPCDDRLYDKPIDGKTKNDHFGDLIAAAHARGFTPECVVFDGWYSSLANVKGLRGLGWHWLTRLKANRKVNPDRTGLRAVSACDIAATGTIVHLEGYGLVKVFRIAAPDGTTDHWATNHLGMTDLDRVRLADASWRIEEYHRGLKQVTNVERCQCRAEVAQRNHIGLAIRAFLVVERWCFGSGVGWLRAKWQIVHQAVQAYRAHPIYRIPPPATI